jgi:2-polyprenyl-3-methyl-5-hydroxy-6-metoxy-1,4-benzoquinol methylase
MEKVVNFFYTHVPAPLRGVRHYGWGNEQQECAMLDEKPNADARFVDYYSEQSASEKTAQRFEGTHRVVMKVRKDSGLPMSKLDVLDVGCGAGTQTMIWASRGHRVTGIDISEPLVELARQRASEVELSVTFQVGSAARLPLPDGSQDVVLVSELLEHLPAWQPCIDEAIRVLKPIGTFYVSTTNWLCPVQQEFSLPLYSWYPGFIKRQCERLAVTTQRHWVQYTTFPAVHWFSFYQLERYLKPKSVDIKDRFDVMDTDGSTARRLVVAAIRSLSPARFAAQVLTPYTLIVGTKRAMPD